MRPEHMGKSWKWTHTNIYRVGLENGEYGDDNDPNSGVETVKWSNGVTTVLPFLPSSREVSVCSLIFL